MLAEVINLGMPRRSSSSRRMVRSRSDGLIRRKPSTPVVVVISSNTPSSHHGLTAGNQGGAGHPVSRLHAEDGGDSPRRYVM